MPGDDTVKRHLTVLLNSVIGAVSATKQVQWATGSSHRNALEELMSFLIDRAGDIADAEEEIGGRSSDIQSPSARSRPNLIAEAGDDIDTLMVEFIGQLRALETDIRVMASDTSGTEHSRRLTELADGLGERLAPLSDDV